MRHTVLKWAAMVIVGGILASTTIVGLSAPVAPLSPSEVVPMSLGQWKQERASQLEEDQDGWDCRVMGNATCGEVTWELVCPTGEQTPSLVCTLEPHKL